jgi:hypothetical protein
MERVTEVMPAPGNKMTLAPEMDAKGFAVAVRESRAIVGADWVFTGAEGIDLLGLQRKYYGPKPAHLEERDGLTVVSVKAFVSHGSNSMPHALNAEIFDAQLDALTRYFTKR